MQKVRGGCSVEVYGVVPGDTGTAPLGIPTSGDIIPGIKIKVEVSKIVTTTGIKNSRNGLDHIKAQGFPFTGIKSLW